MSEQEDIPADISELIRLGTIASVDLGARRCTVRYGDEDDEEGEAETPPIRWLAPRAGRTKVSSPPSEGEQVVLLCPDGQVAAGIALLGLEQDSFPMPAAKADETITEYADGALIGYDAETHALTAILPSEGTAVIDAPAGLRIRGDVEIEGAVSVSGDVMAGGISLRNHPHSGVQAGTALSGGPV